MGTSLVRTTQTDKHNKYLYKASIQYNFNDRHLAVFSSVFLEEDFDNDTGLEFFNV
jgi:hypothetical protein